MWVVLAFTAFLIYKRVTSARPQWKIGKLLRIALVGLGAIFKSILLGLASLLQLSGDAVRLLTVEAAAWGMNAMGIRKSSVFFGGQAAAALSNRESIRRIYLNTLREAERAGMARGPNQTAIEYQGDLLEVCESNTSDVTELTQAFVRARYMRAPIDDNLVAGARGNGDRIRAFLRTFR